MLIQAEDKTIVNTQCIRDIWIYKHQLKIMKINTMLNVT